MIIEYEIKILNIDYNEWLKKLNNVNAHLENKKLQKITIFHGLNNNDREYIRVRDEGNKITLTYKRTYKDSAKADEIEITVSSYERTIELLESIGLKKKRTEEKERISYSINKSRIDIDTWPDIPTYVEIESDSEEELFSICKILCIDYNKSFKGDAHDVFRYYGIDPNMHKNMIFNKNSLNKLK